jgi:hypothetical protein
MKMQRLLCNVAMAPIGMQVVRKGHYPKPKMQQKVLGIEFSCAQEGHCFPPYVASVPTMFPSGC